jgi:hypothetical protein
VRKHVHATVLTTLYGIAARAAATKSAGPSKGCLARCFPALLAPTCSRRAARSCQHVLDVSELGRAHREAPRFRILRTSSARSPARGPRKTPMRSRRASWASVIDEMATQLADRARQVQAAPRLGAGSALAAAGGGAEEGGLDPEDDAHRTPLQDAHRAAQGRAKRAPPTPRAGQRLRDHGRPGSGGLPARLRPRVRQHHRRRRSRRGITEGSTTSTCRAPDLALREYRARQRHLRERLPLRAAALSALARRHAALPRRRGAAGGPGARRRSTP